MAQRRGKRGRIAAPEVLPDLSPLTTIIRSAEAPSIEVYERRIEDLVGLYNNVERAYNELLTTGGPALEERVRMETDRLQKEIDLLHEHLYDFGQEILRESVTDNWTIAMFVEAKMTVMRFPILALQVPEQAANNYAVAMTFMRRQLTHEIESYLKAKIILIDWLLEKIPGVAVPQGTVEEPKRNRMRNAIENRKATLRAYLQPSIEPGVIAAPGREPPETTRVRRIINHVLSLDRYPFYNVNQQGLIFTPLAASLLRTIYRLAYDGDDTVKANIRKYVSDIVTNNPLFVDNKPENFGNNWLYLFSEMHPLTIPENLEELARALGISVDATIERLNGIMTQLLQGPFKNIIGPNVTIERRPPTWRTTLYFAFTPPPNPLSVDEVNEIE